MKTILGAKGLALSEYAIAANAVLGIRDSGKTYTATKAAEELYDAGVPWIALDPIGVWHTLRIPGRGKGYPIVVAGGRYADLPLIIPGKGASPTKNVGEIVRAAMQSGVSVVLDLFSMDLSKADWKRIVRETVEILLHENADYGQRHIFIEEAAEFVPQRMNGADGQVFAAVEKLVRMGGNSKLGCTLINQRSADLNKSVLELCANVFVHRQTGKNTLMDLRKWFDEMGLDKTQRATIQESIPNLDSGECWLLSTELKAPQFLKVPAKNSQHPDRRAAPEAAKAPVRAKASDTFIAEMRAKLVEKAKPAGRQAPVDLSSRPIALEIKAEHLAAAEARGLAKGWDAGYRSGWGDAFDAGHALALEQARDGLAKAKPYGRKIDVPPAPCGPQVAQKRAPAAAAPAKAKTMPLGVQAALAGITKPQAKILESLAWWAQLGHDTPTRIQVAIKAKMKARGGHFKTRVSELSTAGLVSYPDGDRMQLTAPGRAAAPVPDTKETVLDALRSVISNPQAAILEAMLAGHTDRQDIAAHANMDAAGGHFKTRLSELSSMGIVSYPDKSSATIQPWVKE